MHRINKKKWAPSRAVIAAGILLTAITMGIWLVNPPFLGNLDLKWYDMFLKKHHLREISHAPVIVDIDEASLKEYGQWPWPRYRIAALLTEIAQAGPDAVGLDILFTEPDRTSPVRIQKAFKKELNMNVRFSGLPDKFMDHDQMMAGVLKRTPAVLGFYIRFDDVSLSQATSVPLKRMPYRILPPDPQLPETSVEQATGIDKAPIVHAGMTYGFRATEVLPPIAPLASAAAGCGFINALPDADGVLRHMPMLIEYDGALYPSFSLALLGMAKQAGLMTIRPVPGGSQLFFPSTNIPPIRLDEYGNLLIHFKGPNRSYPYYAASDILAGRIPSKNLKNKIVLVGSSASGLKDVHTIPFDSDYTGVEVHAAIIDTVLTNTFLSTPSWGKLLQGIVIALICILFTLVLGFGKTMHGMLTFLLTCAGIYWGVQTCFTRTGMFISPVGPLMTAAACFFSLSLIKFIRTEQDKAFLKNAFSKFVAKPIVDQVVASPQTLKLQGEEKRMSILFADIRQFTTLSEQLAPDQATTFLQEYFTPMTRIITHNNGTLDKFIGDGIMAFWNAPLDIEDHEKWAFQSAVDMLAALGDLNEEFEKKYNFKINIGIGLHAGHVRVGNMGTQDLFNYTVIGDDVNVASRLETLSKFYGVRILFSEEMVPFVPSTHQIQELDRVRVKGRAKPLRIFGLFTGGFMDDPKAHLDAYHQALALYRSAQFEKASLLFSQFKDKKVDRRLYRIYRERCEYFITHPPEKDWDGVFIHQKK